MAATDGRGKKPSKNQPSKGTAKDMRLQGRGAKPGPKVGSKNAVPPVPPAKKAVAKKAAPKKK